MEALLLLEKERHELTGRKQYDATVFDSLRDLKDWMKTIGMGTMKNAILIYNGTSYDVTPEGIAQAQADTGKQLTHKQVSSRGGKNRAKNLSKRRRRAIARQAVNARWARKQRKPKDEVVIVGLPNKGDRQ